MYQPPHNRTAPRSPFLTSPMRLFSLLLMRPFFMLLAGLLLSACGQQRESHQTSSMFGQATTEDDLTGYDLTDIQASGELIAVTLSGPDTYYEYRGHGFGLQFDLAEAFAHTIGAKLRMEMASDTAELLSRLAAGEADIVALELDSAALDASTSAHGSTTGSSTASTPSSTTDLHACANHWVVRASASELAAAIDGWWKPSMKDEFLALEKQRTTKATSVRRTARPVMLSQADGIISRYDDLFIRHASTIGWDWRLMAAQCYQESAFDPQAVSWAGARGLMQIMPGTAAHLGLPMSAIYDPEQNIAAAARYLHELSGKFADVPDRLERINFILAAYNGGHGHVRDAMALARKHGQDPHRWANVDPYILRLSQPQFYHDPVVQNGYLRGSETSGYVRQIQDRWAAYRGSARAVSPNAQPSPSRKKKERRTHVKGREEFMNETPCP